LKAELFFCFRKHLQVDINNKFVFLKRFIEYGLWFFKELIKKLKIFFLGNRAEVLLEAFETFLVESDYFEEVAIEPIP